MIFDTISDNYQAYLTVFAYFLVAANALGFITLEPFKREFMEKQNELKKNKKESEARLMDIYESMTPSLAFTLFLLYQLPVALWLLAFANGSGKIEKYGSAVILLALPHLILGNLKQEKGL